MLLYSLKRTGNSSTEEDVCLIAADDYFKKDEYGTKAVFASSNGKSTVYTVIKGSKNGKITISQYQK